MPDLIVTQNMNQGATRKKGDTPKRTNLEEDSHNREYHSIDPEVATVFNLDKGVTTANV